MTPGGFNAIGWYGYVDKDLRQVLGRPVEGRYSRTYCGEGSLDTCRADLRASLARAATQVAQQQGTADPDAWTYDKQQDRIRSSALGLVNVPPFEFQNRTTFQQVASFTARRAAAPAAAPPAPPGAAGPAAGPVPASRGRAELADTGAASLLPLLAVGALAAAALTARRRRTGRAAD